MSTPLLTGAIADLDSALASIQAADQQGEAPQGVLAVVGVHVRDARDVLADWETA